MSITLTLRPIDDPSLYVKESPKSQAAGDVIVYQLTTTEYSATAPSAPTVTARNLTTDQDVSSVVVSGVTINADDQVEFTVQTLKSYYRYRVAIEFTIGDDTYIRYLEIKGGLPL